MSRLPLSRIGVALAVATVAFVCLTPFAAAQEDRWANAMAAFEEADRTSPPPQGGVIFVGSSSIRLWNLDASFAGKGYINRGFGGSEIADSVRHVDLLINRHEPRVIVMYAGDNDIARGKTPQQVANDFKAFIGKVHAENPDTRIAFIAIKPSIRRWEMVGAMRQANTLIREFTITDDRLGFVDIDGPMFGWDGKPNPAFFVEDGLHMTPEGYEIWAAVLKPFMK